jgi:hypothetical protein
MKLGRRPAVHTRRTMRSALALARALDPLGTAPPASNDYVAAVNAATGGNWQMLGNDQYGCCVEADDGHFLMLRTANVGKIVTPTTADILALYSAETGFNQADPNTDTGTDETSDCQYMVTTGLLGHKADGTAMVDISNLDHVRWSIQLFGSCKFGINLPQSAMNQFNAGQPWTVVADDGGIIGGHDVLGVKYDGTMFYAVTWGKLQPVAPPWILKYADEGHALMFADWIESTGTSPSGFSLAPLLSDLSEIGVDQPPPSPLTPQEQQHHHHHHHH